VKGKVVQFTDGRKVDIVDCEVGDPGPAQARVRTLYTAISRGTELAFYRGSAPQFERSFDSGTRLFTDGAQVKYPLKYGYTHVGEVTAVGDAAVGASVGDVVFSSAGHATGVLVPAREDRHPCRLPAGLDPRMGTFTPLGIVAYNALLDSGYVFGDSVVVFGAGVIGQLAVQMARLAGAGRVTAVDMLESRLELARRSGADEALSPEKTPDVAAAIREINGGRGADLVIECTGSTRALAEAIRCACVDGTVVVSSFYGGEARGLRLGEEFHHNRVRLVSSQLGSVSPAVSNRWSVQRRNQAVVDLLPRLELEPLISHVMPQEKAAEAFAMLDERPDECMHVILEYGSEQKQ